MCVEGLPRRSGVGELGPPEVRAVHHRTGFAGHESADRRPVFRGEFESDEIAGAPVYYYKPDEQQ